MYTARKKIRKNKGVEPSEFEATVAHVLLHLKKGNQELKGDLKDMYINAAIREDPAPVPLLGQRRSLVRFLDLLAAGKLLDGSFTLCLQHVGPHYVASCGPASRRCASWKLLARGHPAPVDYLRTYVPDLGDHRTLDQLRRMISFASSCCSRSWPQGRGTSRCRSLSCRWRAFGCSSSGVATSPHPPLKRIVCHNSTVC
ncbi:hypothetical protein ZWY2020_012053 [Hordeum vulgare]|nr:hypothetical protein ZWY2020_012053 [Hordeum vulgare]